jgi:hypothetical protein
MNAAACRIQLWHRHIILVYNTPLRRVARYGLAKRLAAQAAQQQQQLRTTAVSHQTSAVSTRKLFTVCYDAVYLTTACKTA